MKQIFFTEKLNKVLSDNLRGIIKSVSEFSMFSGIKTYIVGGVVRDLILEKPIYDVDIVVEGNAIEFVRKMSDKNICRISRENPDYGTVKAIFGDTEIDFASTRTEIYPKKGHLPVVEQIGCDLKSDVLRRDFTVNALALSLDEDNFGEIIDYTGGLEDLDKKELRILHENSFIDDPTRIIRALRFRHKLGFQLEEKTSLLQKSYLENFQDEDICYERIKQVFKLAFNLNSAELFDNFADENIYKLVTGIKPAKIGNKIYNCINQNFDKFDNENTWLIYFACAAPIKNIEKFNFTAKELAVFTYVDYFILEKKIFESNFEIYKHFKKAPTESIITYLALTGDAAAKKFIEELKDVKLEISGNDLKKLGLEEGKKIGVILDKILEQKVNGSISTKDEEIRYAKNLMLSF